MKDSSILLSRIDFANSESSPASVQVYAFSQSGAVLGYSDYRKPDGSIMSGSITWSKAIQSTCIRFHMDLLPAEVVYVHIIARVPTSTRLSDASEAAQHSLAYEDLPMLARFDPVPFTGEGSDVDWFVFGVLVIERDSMKRISRLGFRDISAFPNNRGEVVLQLKDLIQSIKGESLSGDEWTSIPIPAALIATPIPYLNDPPFSPAVSSPRTIASPLVKPILGSGTMTFAPGSPVASPPKKETSGGTMTVAPGSPAIISPPTVGHMCSGCRIKDDECRALRAQLLQAQAELRVRHVSGTGEDRASVVELTESVLRLHEANTELEDKLIKQAILIERLRKERRSGLVAELVGPEELMFALSGDGAELNEEKLDGALQMQQQADLIGGIKDQLRKLANQIHNGQRLRAMNAT